ncbi:hypothetical protein Ddye_012431 [Dipteronia dyeriana]|uniref:Reverse transcriptase zinc-binding domain-containing protein n=1 Tax=Dipteronia dyeriana TaxID=168575 RepID=A0AAD9X4B1_9ROSI|nr:hypothetical protein Ddye_012431 [Dipteronia dyeriana]
MRDKGLSLRAKWIWRFGREDSALWRKVICTKYGLSCNSVLWKGINIRTGSNFVRSINKLFCENHRAFSIVHNGINVVVGSGSKVRLWQDVKWDSVPLMTIFPRIFALATNKKGTISEYGNWAESRWVWNVSLRRVLFN